MSDGGIFMFSAAALNTPKGYQMVTPTLPSNEVLQELGRFALRLGQLEHLLKLIYKRSHENVSLDDSLELTISLGTLLNGTHMGKPVEFKGLLHLAKNNQKLASVKTQLGQATRLSRTRKRYLHNGIGRALSGKFVVLDGKGMIEDTIEEPKMREELAQASSLAESLFSELNAKISPTKMEE